MKMTADEATDDGLLANMSAEGTVQHLSGYERIRVAEQWFDMRETAALIEAPREARLPDEGRNEVVDYLRRCATVLEVLVGGAAVAAVCRSRLSNDHRTMREMVKQENPDGEE